MNEKSEGKSIDVSVVVPAYNEAENIPILMEKFSEMFESSGMKGEVILVDDGSTDMTSLRARECQERYEFLRLVTHGVNKGLTAALQTGFKVSRGHIFVFYPADLQYLPEDIPKMIDKINEGFDVVTGWRQGKCGARRFVSFIYNWVSRLLFNIKVHDLNSVKAFRREVVENMTMRRDWHRYLVVFAAEEGYQIEEVKVGLYPRKYGRSKFGFWRISIGVLDLFSVKFQISFMKKPLLLFGSIGITLAVFAFIVGLVAIYFRVVLHQGFRPLLYLVLLLALSGISFFALGFLAEVIVGLREKMESIESKLEK